MKTKFAGSFSALAAFSLALAIGAAVPNAAMAQFAVAKPNQAGAPPPGAPAIAAPAGAPAGGLARAPRIIVVDRNVILRLSSAGKDMMAQVQSLTKQAETQFKGEQDKLQADAAALQQQLAILAPDVRAQKEKDFDARQQSLQSRAQDRQAEIQAGFNNAAQKLDQSLGPILEGIMRERQADMILDHGAVLLAPPDVDVTAVVIDRLNKALPHIQVILAKAPAAAVAAAPAKK